MFWTRDECVWIFVTDEVFDVEVHPTLLTWRWFYTDVGPSPPINAIMDDKHFVD